MDPRIRISTKSSWIRNTALSISGQNWPFQGQFVSFRSERYGKDTQPDAEQKLRVGSNPDPAHKEVTDKRR